MAQIVLTSLMDLPSLPPEQLFWAAFFAVIVIVVLMVVLFDWGK
jgi:hypothetical protein